MMMMSDMAALKTIRNASEVTGRPNDGYDLDLDLEALSPKPSVPDPDASNEDKMEVTCGAWYTNLAKTDRAAPGPKLCLCNGLWEEYQGIACNKGWLCALSIFVRYPTNQR